MSPRLAANGWGRASSARRAIASISSAEGAVAKLRIVLAHRGERRGPARLPAGKLLPKWPPSSDLRSGGRVVEGARLESEYTPKAYRGFESLPLRHMLIH